MNHKRDFHNNESKNNNNRKDKNFYSRRKTISKYHERTEIYLINRTQLIFESSSYILLHILFLIKFIYSLLLKLFFNNNNFIIIF